MNRASHLFQFSFKRFHIPALIASNVLEKLLSKSIPFQKTTCVMNQEAFVPNLTQNRFQKWVFRADFCNLLDKVGNTVKKIV